MHPYATMPFIGEGLDPPIYEPQQHILSSVYALTGSENVHTGQPQGFYYATAAFGALEASYPLQIINRRTGMKMGMRPPPDSQMLLHGIPSECFSSPRPMVLVELMVICACRVGDHGPSLARAINPTSPVVSEIPRTRLISTCSRT